MRSLLNLLALLLKPMAGFSPTPDLPFLPLLCPPFPCLPVLSPASQKEPVKAFPPSTVPIKTFAYPLHHIWTAGRSSRKINPGSGSPPLHHSIVYTVGWPLHVGLLPQDKMGNKAKVLPLSVFPSTYQICLQPQPKILA